eukprot:364584-Chlamydomonas_euryale.AAC.5
MYERVPLVPRRVTMHQCLPHLWNWSRAYWNVHSCWFRHHCLQLLAPCYTREVVGCSPVSCPFTLIRVRAECIPIARARASARTLRRSPALRQLLWRHVNQLQGHSVQRHPMRLHEHSPGLGALCRCIARTLGVHGAVVRTQLQQLELFAWRTIDQRLSVAHQSGLLRAQLLRRGLTQLGDVLAHHVLHGVMRPRGQPQPMLRVLLHLAHRIQRLHGA